jgi:hypothetical protein
LAGYKSEEPIVKNHLHLMAVMKMVYLKLGREAQLQQIIETDSKIDNPGYQRAWQIVNEIEGHHAFVQELRQ